MIFAYILRLLFLFILFFFIFRRDMYALQFFLAFMQWEPWLFDHGELPLAKGGMIDLTVRKYFKNYVRKSTLHWITCDVRNLVINTFISLGVLNIVWYKYHH